MRPQKRYLFILWTFVCSFTCHAQNYVDLLRLSHNQSTNPTFNSDQTARFDESTIDFILPIKIDSTLVFLPGANLEHTTLSLDTLRTTEIYGLTAKLGVNLRHNERWSGTYLLLPKISSDLKKWSNYHLQMGAIAILNYQKSKTLKYRVGFYSNTDLFGPMLVPILGFYFKKERLETNFALPIGADMNYQIHPIIKLGTKFQGINKSYAISGNTDTYIEKINNELSAYGQLALGKWNLIVAAGHSFSRTQRQYASNDKLTLALSAIKIGNNRTPINQSFSDSFFIKSSLVFRFPTS